MASTFDKWLPLKIVEFLFVVACLVCKGVTDDEQERLFLYLKKLSREWSFFTSVTWDQIGSAVADAVYGGYTIITLGMIIGRALKELPTKTRAMERFYLGIGAMLFIILGGLEYASLDSLPPDLLDNAAVLGTLSLITGILFLIDLAAPRLKESTKPSQTSPKLQLKPIQAGPDLYSSGNGIKKETIINGHSKERASINGKPKVETNGIEQNQRQKKFDIYGKDTQVAELPVKMEKHSPVFSKVQRPQYGVYDNYTPSYLRFESDVDGMPSTPGDPGYVQYTAKRWGQPQQKAPRSSPTEV